MAKYTFTGPAPVVYIDLGFEAQPGDTLDLDTAPDGWWTSGKADPTPKAPESAPEADSAPSDVPTDPTPTN